MFSTVLGTPLSMSRTLVSALIEEPLSSDEERRAALLGRHGSLAATGVDAQIFDIK